MIKRENQSDKNLVVHSLTVLTDIKGGGVDTLKDQVNSLSQSQQTLSQQQENYWKSIADDNNVTPEEKKILYKEWKEIQSEYAKLLEEASAAQDQPQYKAYVKAYEDLYYLLIVDLKMFDSMSSTTQLEDRDIFISNYESYYNTRDTLRASLYGALSTYFLDLTPEFQGFPATKEGAWIDSSLQVEIQAFLRKGTDGVNYAQTYKAVYNGAEVGTWTVNKVTIPLSTFTSDVNYISVTVTDPEGIVITALFTVAKITEADFKYYRMQLSDNAVHALPDGTITEPKSITVTKIITTNEYVAEVDYGIVKVKVDDGEETELVKYKKVTTEEYSEDKEYFTRLAPFYLTIEGIALQEDRGAVMVFYA